MNLHDVNVIEGLEEADEIESAKALQRAINGGIAWSFQGHYGREMMSALKNARCVLGRNSARDYWGNHIPSRDQIKPGHMGSIEFVAQHRGEEYAQMISGV